MKAYTAMDSLQVNRYFPMKVRDSVFIRPLKETDASGLFQTIDKNRAYLSTFLPWVPAVKEVVDSGNFIKSAIAQETYATGLHCGIFQTGGGGEEVVGVVALRTINGPTKTAQTGYWLSKDKEGTGLCTLSCRKLIEYGQAIGIEKFEIQMATGNLKSEAVAKRLGFSKLPGEIRGAEVVDNNPVNHIVFLLVKLKVSPKSFGKFLTSGIDFKSTSLVGLAICAIAMLAMVLPWHQQPVSKKHLLLVGGGWNASWNGYMYDVAKSMNIELSVADLAGHWTERLVLTKRIYTFHSIDSDGTADQLTRDIHDILANSGIEFSGVTTKEDRYLVAIANAAKMAGLPTLEPQTFANVRDKVILKFLINSKIPVKRISSNADLASASKDVGFPSVLRPVFGEGSLAARLIQSKVDLIESYAKLKENVDALKLSLEDNTDLMLEKYVPGAEYDVDIIMEKGVAKFAAVTLNTIGTAPWFQERNLTIPTTRIDAKTQKNMAGYAEATCNQVGLTDGVFHVEIIMNDNELHLIEINARMGGLLTRFNVKIVYGVDILEFFFKIAMGMPVSGLRNRGILDDDFVCIKHITTHYINVARSGFIKDDTFLDSIARDDRVVYTVSMVNKGQRVIGPEEGVPYLLGAFIVQSETSAEDSERVADSLLQMIDQQAIIEPPLSYVKVDNSPVLGMEDVFGVRQRKFNALSSNMENVALRYGFEELLVPLVERSTSFAEDIVGLSPWPEWDPKGMLLFRYSGLFQWI